MAGTLGYFLYGFMEPILAFRVKQFNLSQVEIGFFFIIMPIFYIPTSMWVQNVPNGIEKRMILIVASFLSFFTNLWVGPSLMFPMPNKMWVMMVGQAIRGIVDPFLLIPSLPEMIECQLSRYPPSVHTQINDISSGMFNMFLGIGQISGPLFGAIVTEYYGFQNCCDSVSIICLTFSILYYITCDGKEAVRMSRWADLSEQQKEIKNKVKMGVMSPCSNRISVRSFTKTIGQSIRVNKDPDPNNDAELQNMSQHHFERTFNLLD